MGWYMKYPMHLRRSILRRDEAMGTHARHPCRERRIHDRLPRCGSHSGDRPQDLERLAADVRQARDELLLLRCSFGYLCWLALLRHKLVLAAAR